MQLLPARLHVWRASPHSRSSNGSCCGQQGCERYLGRGADAEKKTGFLTPFLTPKAAAAAPKKPKGPGPSAAAERPPKCSTLKELWLKKGFNLSTADAHESCGDSDFDLW